MISQSYLKDILHYSPETGVFTWLVNKSNKSQIGTVAGKVSNESYRQIGIDYKKYLSHRLAWIYINGSINKDDDIDHINHDRSDNSIKNLRLVNKSENQRNRSKNKNNTSGFCGVTLIKRTGKWQAQIFIEGELICLGTFKDKGDAIEARINANKKHSFHKNHGVK